MALDQDDKNFIIDTFTGTEERIDKKLKRMVTEEDLMAQNEFISNAMRSQTQKIVSGIPGREGFEKLKTTG